MAQGEQHEPRKRFKPIREALEDSAPWKPAEWGPSDAGAIQALMRGDAPPHLQQRALDFIITKLCRTYDMPYRPGDNDGRRDTDFALGMQWVGQQIVKLTKVRIIREGEQQ